MAKKVLRILSIKSITAKNLPFFISWVIIFVWLYSYFLPFGQFRFESNIYNDKVSYDFIFTFIWLITCPLITFFLDPKKYVSTAYISVLVALICFFTMRYTPQGIAPQALLCISSVCIGHIFAASCYSFFMILNNTEKFYSMLLAVFIPKAFLFLKPILNHPNKQMDISTVIILIFMIILTVCCFLFRNKTNDMPTDKTVKPPKKAYTLMPLVFVVLALNDVIAPTDMKLICKLSQNSFEPFYFAGILFGTIIIILLQKVLKIGLYNILNLSFVFVSIGFISSILSLEIRFFGIISPVLFGTSYILGFVNIYYLAGLMAKRFQSILFYQIGIALSSLYYIVAIIFTQLLEKADKKDTIIMISFISVCILISFLFLAPFFVKNLCSGEWMDDSYRDDVTHDSRITAKLKEYHLSPREIETCLKLLEGYTLRQIAAMMKLSYPTINTYCNSIYKKFNINSRTELLVLLQQYNT